MPNSSPIYSERNYNMDQIRATAEELKVLETELNGLFPERDFLIRQMILAVLSRMHVLMHGTYGTGKSLLIKQFIQGIGANKDEIFSITMSRHTTEADLFGPVHVPTLREEGIQRRNAEGTIRQARFAKIDEFFDSPHQLRSLLEVLNERRYSRGADSGDVPLHSAFAATNISPDELTRRFPENDAIIDRFLFQAKVEWLQEEGSLRTMLQGYVRGLSPVSIVSHDGLEAAAKLVQDPTDQIKSDFIDHFLEVAMLIRQEWKTEGWRQFSDRAMCLWLEILEANAVRCGRYDVTLEDLYSLKYVATDGSEAQIKAFETLVHPKVDEMIDKQRSMTKDQALRLAMDAVRGSLPTTINWAASDSELVAARRQLAVAQGKAGTMVSEQPQMQREINQLQQDIQQWINNVETLISEGSA